MNNVFWVNVFRLLFLVILQVLVLRQASLEWSAFPLLNILIYPLFIILLPFRMSKELIMIIAFLLGLLVDMFYNSPGVHASATVFMGFLRPVVLAQLRPRGGYNVNYSPTLRRMGWAWFALYLFSLLFFHLLIYFSVEGFGTLGFGQILARTVVSLLLSGIFILILMRVFNPID